MDYKRKAFNLAVKEHFRSLLQNNKVVGSTGEEDDELMDGVDLEKYLKCCRRTIYLMRKDGLPFIQKQNGRIYYWKSQVNEYLGKPPSHT